MTPPASRPRSLLRVPRGQRRTILGTNGPHRAELAREGLVPGREVAVVARAPLGGPVVVTLGRARLALSADVAAGVWTVACEPETVA